MILFFSDNRSVAIVEEAMRCGARGFLLKSGAANELLPANKISFCRPPACQYRTGSSWS
jgi:DNA-binding NarL/FixJ family response regulator